MLTDDQDQIIGGWGSDDSRSGGKVSTPTMTQTDRLVAARGATATNWRIHTPICAPSRAQLMSGRYYHNVANNATGPAGATWVTPSGKVTSGAVGMLDLGNNVWPYHFGTTLREKKGYVTGLFGMHGPLFGGPLRLRRQQAGVHRRGAEESPSNGRL
jgi:arylsulfatase A-like enzyme